MAMQQYSKQFESPYKRYLELRNVDVQGALPYPQKDYISICNRYFMNEALSLNNEFRELCDSKKMHEMTRYRSKKIKQTLTIIY